MRSVGNKDLQQIVDTARRDGWTIDFSGSGDRLKWTAPRGGGFFFSGYNSQGYALKQIEGDMRRLARAMPPAPPVGNALPIKAKLGDVVKITVPIPNEPYPKASPILPTEKKLLGPVAVEKPIISSDDAVELIHDEIERNGTFPARASELVFSLYRVSAKRSTRSGDQFFYQTVSGIHNAMIDKYPQHRVRNTSTTRAFVTMEGAPLDEQLETMQNKIAAPVHPAHLEPPPPPVDLGAQVRHLMDTPGITDQKKQALLRVLLEA